MSKSLSLVVATRGRASELERLLHSLATQSWTDFDVIVVDQNPKPILDELFSMQWPFSLQHIRTPDSCGACRARNVGWRQSSGQVLLFPDDDCWYPSNFLESGLRCLAANGAQVLAGRAADEIGRSINGRFETQAGNITANNVWTTSIEWVAFFERNVLEAVGGFDENIGIGADSPWQSCESQDIVLRALEAGFACSYNPGIFGHHDELNTTEPDAAQIAKGRGYARGMGWVLRKHRVSWLKRIYWATRPLAKSWLSTLHGRSAAARYLKGVALGRWEGARGRLVGPG